MSANPVARPSSRRTFLTAAAAGTLAGGATFAAKSATVSDLPDPIFALIEIERAAWDEFLDVNLRYSRIEGAHHDGDATIAKALIDEAELQSDEAHDAWKVASDRLVDATPTTIAGLLALIERFEVRTEGCMVDNHRDGLTSLLAHVRTFLTREARDMARTSRCALHEHPARTGMSAALPTIPIITGEYRALTVYDAVPQDCGSVPAPDDSFAPHLRAGELAIVDPDDNEPVHGEIYVITVSSPREPNGYRLAFVQLRGRMLRLGTERPDGGCIPDPEDSLAWMMDFQLQVARPTPMFYATMEDAEGNVSTWRLSDGPMRTDGMRSKIVGRVVGVVKAA